LAVNGVRKPIQFDKIMIACGSYKKRINDSNAIG
jgi:hypothetical protein